MRRTPVVLNFLLFSAVVTTVPAVERTLTLDPATTEVAFGLKATAHTVEGTFALASGEIRFDPDTGSATGVIVIDARSGDTENDRRDRKMHEKVLESERHPRFTFTPERFDGSVAESGPSEVEVHGTLTVRGEAHPVTLSVTVEIDGDTLSAQTALTVPYVEWGMKDPSVFVLRVAKVVEVKISAAGRLSR